MEVRHLARALAEPALLGRGLRPWNRGHASLVAARLLDAAHGLPLDASLPRAPVALALARTLVALRAGAVDAARLEAAAAAADTGEDRTRVRAIASLYRAFTAEVDGHFADGVTLLRAAAEALPRAGWLHDADVLVVDDLELDPAERVFVAALARVLPVRALAQEVPPQIAGGGFAAWAAAHGVGRVSWADSPLGALAPPPPPAGLARLRARLFEAPVGPAIDDGSVELLTAAGEASEVKSVVRRLLREAARGVPFEEMGVVLPRPDTYAPLFTDLLARLGIPHRLHPSLPLRGRPRDARAATAAALPRPRPRRGDGVPDLRARAVRRAAGRGHAHGPRALGRPLARSGDRVRPRALDRRPARVRRARARQVEGETDEWRLARAAAAAEDAESLLRLAELLSSTLETLAGSASWPEWSARLQAVCDQWIGPADDRETLVALLADLGGLQAFGAQADWTEVERVLLTRVEWERLPMPPVTAGAVHLGAFDAIAGLPFRVVAIPGLVEGGFPGAFRLDPFLLDHEREALGEAPAVRAPAPSGQLALFGAPEAAPARAGAGGRPPPAHRAGSPDRGAAPVPPRAPPGDRAPRALLPAGRRALGPRAGALAVLRGGGRGARGRAARCRTPAGHDPRGRPRRPAARGRSRRGRARPHPGAPRRPPGGARDRRRRALLQGRAPRRPRALVEDHDRARRPGRGSASGARAAARPADGAAPRLGQRPRTVRDLRLPVPACRTC